MVKIFQKFLNWIRQLFGKVVGYRTQRELSESDKHRRAYEDLEKTNFAEVFAASLANKAVTDSTMTITDQNDGQTKRTELLSASLGAVWDSMKGVLTQALGKGGMFFIPHVVGDRVHIAAVDQTRCSVNQILCGEIVSLSVIAEVREVNQRLYQRIIDYTLENRVLTIRTKVVDAEGREVPGDTIPDWADITPEITIGNVEHVPVGYLKCPKNNRREDDFYGVPITYGSEDLIRQLYECMDDIEDEYRLKHTFVGADEMLFGKDNKLPQNGLFKKFRVTGDLNKGNFWEVFDPAIRDSSYYNRFNSLCAMLEKSVGTSKGVLTEPASFGATATEIRSANYDTFCLVSDIRRNIEKCFDALAYGVDVYAEFFRLSPSGAAGDYKVTFDWDMNLVESSSETFDQLSELESRGLISGARLNAWVTGQTMEEAQAEIDAAAKEREQSAVDMALTAEDEAAQGENGDS